MLTRLIFIATILHFAKCSNPTVELPLGKIEGHLKETVNGRNFYAFEGVPYAKPPVNELRFEAPQPVEPWIGVWQAKTIFKCAQYEHYAEDGTYNKVSGDEDCLYLNIYTPNVKGNLNVLVYIHGGAFMFNYGAIYGPDMILDKDIVFININYRLGPLGFLSTEDDVVPGNNGMKDQTLALKWIAENIKHFGGNPNSITIFGMSAGGASTELHYLMPQSKGLFDRGISQSGCSLNPWVLMEKPLEKAKKVAETVGCPTDNTKSMVQCLKTKPARQICSSVKHFQPWLYNPFSPFAVVVDTWSEDPVLPEHPLKLLKDKKVADLPWMTTYVSGEGLYPGSDFYNDESIEFINENWNKVMPYILHYNDVVPEDQLDTVSEKIRQHFLNNKKVTKYNFGQFIEIISQRLFNVGIEKSGRLHSAAVQSDVYSYYFDYRGEHSRTEDSTQEDIGVSHADDTAYILKTAVETRSTENDVKISNILIDIVTSFMKTGTPGITNWKPLSKTVTDPWVHARINSPDDITLEEKTQLSDNEFWESLHFEENEQLIKHDEL